MRRVVVLLAILVALVMPVAAKAQTGLYAGINGTYAIRGTVLATQDGSGREAIKPSGGLFGLQVGYSYFWQNGLMVGAEADYMKTSIRGSESYLACPAIVCGVNVTQKNDLEVQTAGTVRARVGLRRGNYVPYITAGYAYGNATVNASFGGMMPNVKLRVDPTGWVAGAGVDYWLGEHWSLRTEYVHSALADGPMRFRANIVRFGFNYLF